MNKKRSTRTSPIFFPFALVTEVAEGGGGWGVDAGRPVEGTAPVMVQGRLTGFLHILNMFLDGGEQLKRVTDISFTLSQSNRLPPLVVFVVFVQPDADVPIVVFTTVCNAV